MRDRIVERLREIEGQHGFRIIYSCESGSRAWGFASEDSDYDVRFIYLWKPEDYLGIYPPENQLDLGVDSENLDFSGWDLRKALPLFRKSNGALTEWLQSPIVYFEDPEIMAQWRELAPKYFVPKATAVHYLGLCRKMWLGSAGQEMITAKKYLYILRSLLAARYICENRTPAPVQFLKILDSLELEAPVAAAVKEIVQAKARQKEADKIARIAALDQFFEAEAPRLQESADHLSADQGRADRLDGFFRNAIGYEQR